MSTWLEKLTITLFLLLGLSAFSIAKSEEIPHECPVSGHVYLRLHGDVKNGQLMD
jgi:hypothetical protein